MKKYEEEKEVLRNKLRRLLKASDDDYDTATPGYDAGYSAGRCSAFAQVLEILERSE